MPEPSLEAHRRALLLAQGADPDDPDRSIAAALRADTATNATVWSILAAMLSVPLAFATHLRADFAIGAVLAVVGMNLFVRLLGRMEDTWDAELQRKFVMKKRRHRAVFRGRWYRVGSNVHGLLQHGVRYRLHTNASGALVVDVAPP